LQSSVAPFGVEKLDQTGSLNTIFDYLLSKEIMAEYSKMEAILHHARKAEEGINQTATWYNTRCIIRAERLAQRTENIPKRYINQ